jgi:hypothetical protein
VPSVTLRDLSRAAREGNLDGVVETLRMHGGLSREHWRQIVHEIRRERDDTAATIRRYAQAVLSSRVLDKGFRSRSYLGSRHWWLIATLTDPAKPTSRFRRARRYGPHPDLLPELCMYARAEAAAFVTADDRLARFFDRYVWWPGWRSRRVQGFEFVESEDDPGFGRVEIVVKWDDAAHAWIHAPFGMTTGYTYGAYDHSLISKGVAQDRYLRVFLRPLIAEGELPGVDLVHSSPSQLQAILRESIDEHMLRERLEKLYGPTGPWERRIES